MAYSDIAYPYIEVDDNCSLAIPLEEIKSYLKLSDYNNVVDDELSLMCRSALDYAEKYTRQYFSVKTITTNRCFWGEFRNGNLSSAFTLRRSPLREVESITYTDTDGNEQVLSEDNYKVAKIQNGYSKIILTGSDLPEVIEDMFPIEIKFKVGREAPPDDIKSALLQHIASMWLNRGDCDDDTYNRCPAICKQIYKKYKIIEVGA